jgi:hypothetical protein
MSTTKKGDELAGKLLPYIGMTEGIRETCAKICRHAATLHRLNEDECNGHPAQDGRSGLSWETIDKLQAKWEQRVEAGQERAERLLEGLVRDLPDGEVDGVRFAWKLQAETDPRGCTVILGSLDVHGDSWGDRNGICVP